MAEHDPADRQAKRSRPASEEIKHPAEVLKMLARRAISCCAIRLTHPVMLKDCATRLIEVVYPAEVELKVNEIIGLGCRL